MNELLLWMSVRGGGGIGPFQTKAAELGSVRRTGPALHRLAEWNLSLLGHAEFGAAADGGWRVAPPALAASDICGPYRAVLCGARTPEIVEKLIKVAGSHLSTHEQTDGPDVIEIVTSSAAELLTICKAAALPLQWNAPLAVLWACTPPREQMLKPALMPTGAWIVSRFSKSRLEWVTSTLQDARSTANGLFRFKSDQGSLHILKSFGEILSVESAVGKYRILKRRNRVLKYDASLLEFSVPITCRPPPLVERALAISSGHLPVIKGGDVFYNFIARELAEAVASTLGQRLNWRTHG